MRKTRPLWQCIALYLAVPTALAAALGEIVDEVPFGAALQGTLIIAVLGSGSWLLSRRIGQWLDEYSIAAGQYADGRFLYRAPASDWNEFERLSDALNQMARQIDQRMRTILRHQSEQEAMFASMNEGVLAVDNRGIILNLNDTCAELLETPEPMRLKGRLVHEVIRKADLLAFVDSVLASQMPREGEIRVHGRENRWLNAHGTVLRDADRQTIGAIVVFHDVTQLRRLEIVRRDFVANVSHELRTPITSIKGFVETLLDGAGDDRQSAERFLRIVLRQVNRLNAIIEDLLILSRIEKGAEDSTIELGYACLAEVLHAAVEMCQRRAAEKGVTISVGCPAELTTRMNSHLLEQAVVNLVDNAVKYSESGSTVSLAATCDEQGVSITVEDEGCGIEPRHLPRLFERFYRVDQARSRQLGGTGLGLAIVRHIALAHHGSVSVRSTVGVGSTFTLRLPAAAAIHELTKS